MRHLHFNKEELNRIFPFHIIMDRELQIISHGPSIIKLTGDCEGKKITSVFEFTRPHLIEVNADELRKVQHELMILKTIRQPFVLYRGQIEFLLDDNKILLIGSAWFDTIDNLNESGLMIKDFPAHNPMVDLLHIMQNQEIANEEMKQLLELLDQQKNQIRESKQELEESNRRYEYLNKASTEAIWDLDLMTGKMYHGEGFERMFGYNPILMDVNEHYWNEFLHPEDVKRVTENLQMALNNRDSHWNDAFRYLRSDGQYAYIQDRAYIVRNQLGIATRMVGAMRDVTHQIERERHLNLLESVIKNTNDGIMITGASEDTPIIFVNEAFTQITGYTQQEVLGKNPRIFQGPNSQRGELRKLKIAIQQKKSCKINTINYKKSGEEFWADLTITPVSNEKEEHTHWIAIERDITEQIYSLNEMENQKKFNEEILNNIPADIAVFDNQHRYLFINPNAIRDKSTRDWLIGKNDFDYVKWKNTDDVQARFRRDIFNKTIENNKTFEWVDEHEKDGKKFYVLRKFYPYFENRKLKFVIGYGIDITERKLIEIKLENAIKDIQGKNAELEQFAYVASHDLQEPLRMVSSFLTQLEKKYAEQLDKRAKEYIFYAVDGAKRMRQIILDLLDFSRVGRTDEKKNEIDLQQLVNEIKLLYNKQIKDLNAEINTNQLPVVFSYRTSIRQLFQNLMGNSLKYHKKGVAPRIFIQAEDKQQFWEFSITDNGIGIDPQYHDKIFTIFQRLHTRTEYDGTGIGLAITKKIIETLGGKIWVSSEENIGSTFYFTLPK